MSADSRNSRCPVDEVKPNSLFFPAILKSIRSTHLLFRKPDLLVGYFKSARHAAPPFSLPSQAFSGGPLSSNQFAADP